MRVAVFSDVHGNIVALDACLADLAAQGGADRIVAAGDLCMDGPRPAHVLRRLHEINAQCVRGNTDRMIATADAMEDDEDRAGARWQREQLGPEWVAWLDALPPSLAIGDDEGGLLVCHANPKNDDEHVWPDAPDEQLERLFGDVVQRTVAFGHLHLSYVRMWRDRLLIDVASAGLPKDGDPRVHYVILTARSGGWEVKSRRVEFDVDKVERQLKKSGMPDVEKRITVLRRHRYKELGAVIP